MREKLQDAIKPAIIKNRCLGFVLQYTAYDNEFWRKVIFLMKKSFSTSDQKIKHFHKLKYTRFWENNLFLNKRSKRIGLGFWGYVSGDFIGEIFTIEENLQHINTWILY